jgi:hypothetical protein
LIVQIACEQTYLEPLKNPVPASGQSANFAASPFGSLRELRRRTLGNPVLTKEDIRGIFANIEVKIFLIFFFLFRSQH